MDVLILVSIIRLYHKVKTEFLHNSTKNFFLSACYCLDKSIYLRDVNQQLLFGGKSGYRESYLDYVFDVPKSLGYKQYYTKLLE